MPVPVAALYVAVLALTGVVVAPRRIVTTMRSAIAGLIGLCLVGCGGPFLVFPGGALRGEVVTAPVDNWSFASDLFVDLETQRQLISRSHRRVLCCPS